MNFEKMTELIYEKGFDDFVIEFMGKMEEGMIVFRAHKGSYSVSYCLDTYGKFSTDMEPTIQQIIDHLDDSLTNYTTKIKRKE